MVVLDAEASQVAGRAGAVEGVPVHVYEPYAAHLPPLRTYLREVGERRRFAYRMAHATLKGRNYETVFGQLWLVINPLLLAAVYFMLVTVLAGSQHRNPLMGFTVILSGLFSYYYTRNIIQLSSTSITGGGKMIMNMAFPKALLPLSSLFSSFMMYWPTLVVYAVAHLAAGRAVGLAFAWLVPIFVVQTVFSFGCGLLFAAMAVYFRDTSSLLPYALRIWIYLSPVLFTVSQAKLKLAGNTWLLWIFKVNPLYPIIGSWNQVILEDRAPDAVLMLYGTAWALVSLVGGAWFFLSREREFAYRI
ncbi:ABC transporter permease [Yinghuangia seranimata]|uniref:ABC transporter permease n=1 Tax=Yinghuangia seranimata TaxID=408067 RepID=UPI00248A97B8|nr:ABC transporter permease [Yinghuangia seranimata]MDI2132263.1 ABC transporter permease [Yinghuangia seranimata]